MATRETLLFTSKLKCSFQDLDGLKEFAKVHLGVDVQVGGVAQ